MHVVGVISPLGTTPGSLSGGFFMFNDQAAEGWENTASVGSDPAGRYYSWLPYGVSALGRPMSVAQYAGRTYLCGGHTYNLMVDEHHRVWKQGLRGPEIPPTIAGAAGSGNIGYLSWFDELTNERSPLSQGTVIGSGTPRTWQSLPIRPPDEQYASDGTMTYATGILSPDSPSTQSHYLRPGDRVSQVAAGTGVSYNMINTVGVEAFTLDGSGPTSGSPSGVSILPVSRATHLELWLSIAGGLPRLVMQLPVGTTSVAESLSAGQLGETFIGAFERFPRCTMNTIYHDRQVMAGDPDNPDTVYLSDLFLPERYAGLSLRTRSGDPVTGLLGMRDYCLIFTRDQTYVLQGYTTSDFTLTLLEQSLGSVGHNCNKIVHGSAYIWTEKGPYMYNGAWHPLSPENDFSQPAASESGFIRSEVDPDTNTYIVMPYGAWDSNDQSAITLVDKYLREGVVGGGVYDGGIFVFDYTTVQPEEGGVLASARFSIDKQDLAMTGTTDYVEVSKSNMINWHLSNKWGLGRMYMCSYNSSTNPNDAFVVYYAPRRDEWQPGGTGNPTASGLQDPSFQIILGHHYINEPGGSYEEGKAFQRLWFDVENHAESEGTIRIYSGDEDAYAITTFANLQLHESGYALSNLAYREVDISRYLVGAGVSRLVQVMEPAQTLSGRGLTIVLTWPDLGLQGIFKGWGGAYVHGPATHTRAIWQAPV